MGIRLSHFCIVGFCQALEFCEDRIGKYDGSEELQIVELSPEVPEDTFHFKVKLDLKYRDEEDVVRDVQVTSPQLLTSLSATLISRTRTDAKKHCQDL